MERDAKPSLTGLSHQQLARSQSFAILNHLHHVGNRPKLAGHAGGHRRGHAQGLVDAYEVVVREVDRDRMSLPSWIGSRGRGRRLVVIKSLPNLAA